MLSIKFCLFNAHHKIRFAISNHEWVFNQFSMDETKPPLYCFIPDFFSFEFYIFNIHKFCVTVILCPLLWSIFFSNFFRSIVVSCVKNPIIFTLLHRYSPVAHMCVCKTSAHLAARVEDNSMLYCCALRATRSLSLFWFILFFYANDPRYLVDFEQKKHIDVPIVRFEKFGNRLIVWMRQWSKTEYQQNFDIFTIDRRRLLELKLFIRTDKSSEIALAMVLSQNA